MRSNVIVGFPGETEDDLQTLCDFLEAARMDVTGVFGYSDEDGTEAAAYDGKLDEDEVRARTEHVTALVEELNAQRAEERIGETRRGARRVGRRTAGRRGPGGAPGPGGRRHHAARAGARGRRVGDLVAAEVVDTDGVDLVARSAASTRAPAEGVDA